MAWYDSIIDFIKDVPDNYKKYKDIVDVGGSAAKAYLDYKNQKARNELEESAYTDYMKAAEAAGQEAQAAIDLNLTPMTCLLYTSPSPRDRQKSRMPSSA